MDIHRCRFVEYTPSAINALAFSPTAQTSQSEHQSRLAVGRSNGDIEIWNPLEGTWLHESTLYGGKDRSIEGLVWTQDPEEEDEDGHSTPSAPRLFSIGCSNTVTEWDLATGFPLRQSDGSHSEVWCIAAQPVSPLKKSSQKSEAEGPRKRPHQKLAVGCADGSVILLSTSSERLGFERYLARTSEKKSRALCICWKSSNLLAVGFADSTIRVYQIGKNRADPLVRTISLGGGPRGGRKEKLIWALTCLPDGTLVSGDSTGEVCWWDKDNYGQLQKIQAHEADTLCLASSSDGKTIFSGGIDRRTVVYTAASNVGYSGSRWSKSTHARIHKNDVKAMATLESGKMSVVVSGGPDAQLTINPLKRFRDEMYRRIPFVPQSPPVAGARRLILSWWSNQVSIWRLRDSRTSLRQMSDPSPDNDFEVVARMGMKGEENITAASLSSDARLLAISTVAEIKLFSLRHKQRDGSLRIKISKVTVPPKLANCGARLVQFSPDSKWLAVVTSSNKPSVFRISYSESAGAPSLTATAESLKRRALNDVSTGHWQNYQQRINCATFASDSSSLAMSDLAGHVHVWRLSGAKPTMNGVNGVDGRSEAETSSSEDSDGEDPQRTGKSVVNDLHKESWQSQTSENALPRLEAAPLAISFSPKPIVHQSSNSHSSGTNDASRHRRAFEALLVITAKHEILEFSTYDGRLTSWSRRNPASCLPGSIRLQRERVMGCFWDHPSSGNHSQPLRRLWIYGATWLGMIDTTRDLPIANANGSKSLDAALVPKREIHSRKRKREDDALMKLQRGKHTSGAGSKKHGRDAVEATYSLKDGKRLSPQNGRGSVVLNSEDSDSSDDDNENKYSAAMLRQRRGSRNEGSDDDESSSLSHAENNGVIVNGAFDEDIKDGDGARVQGPTDAQAPPFYFTTKYRPILGIVPLAAEQDAETGELVNGARPTKYRDRALEVALVERPEHDFAGPERVDGR